MWLYGFSYFNYNNGLSLTNNLQRKYINLELKKKKKKIYVYIYFWLEKRASSSGDLIIVLKGAMPA